MIFSITEIRNFRRCRRLWDYSSANRQNLTKIGIGSSALELGSVIHRALAQWILQYDSDADEPVDLGAIFAIEAAKRVEEASNKYRELVGASISTEELGPMLNMIDLGVAMMNRYQEYHGSPIPKNMKFASPEQEILIPIPNTEHYIRATLDGLMQDSKGRFYVLEHKTYDNRPGWEYLQMDDQFVGYAYVASQVLKDIGPVVGVAYDGLWKRAKPPVTVDKRKGTIDDLFLRKIITKSESEIEQWGINVAKTINDMANDPYIVPNVPWQGCFDCSGFKQVCMAQMRGDNIDLMIKQNYTQNDIIRVTGIRQYD